MASGYLRIADDNTVLKQPDEYTAYYQLLNPINTRFNKTAKPLLIDFKSGFISMVSGTPTIWTGPGIHEFLPFYEGENKYTLIGDPDNAPGQTWLTVHLEHYYDDDGVEYQAITFEGYVRNT